MEFESGRSTAANNLDATPEHILRVTGAQCFHRSFLRSESSGKMNLRVSAPHAVRNLSFCEESLNESVAIPGDGRCDARDIRRVDAKADDRRHNRMILPQPGECFEWRQTAFGPALLCRPLEAVARHLFTTRSWTLGASSLADPAAWSELAAAMDTPSESLIRLKQVHGQTTMIAELVEPGTTTNPAEGDIILSGVDVFAIAVQAADCVPLLIADGRLGVVAAAHAGWRGLAQGVPRQAVAGLVRTYGSRPQDLLAAIGPSVGSCCYEVGTDVIDAFVVRGFARDQRQRWFSERPTPTLRNPSVSGLPPVPRAGHAYFDGWTCAREQLLEAGLLDTHVFGAELCTASHSTVLCSYRCDGRHVGRMAGVIRARIPA